MAKIYEFKKTGWDCIYETFRTRIINHYENLFEKCDSEEERDFLEERKEEHLQQLKENYSRGFFINISEEEKEKRKKEFWHGLERGIDVWERLYMII